MELTVASRYFEYLTVEDVAFLAEIGGREVERLRAQPGLVLELLSREDVFEAVFGSPGAPGGTPTYPVDPLRVSPFLVFAVAVARAETELGQAAFVHDWFGPRRRVAVFDAPALRELLGDPAVRLFLAQLLASYTHVASGSIWVQRRGGWRRQRFSELDPVRLAALLEVVPEAERVGIYRRLGDLALFLTGVFPDHTATRAFGPVHAERLLRLAGVEGAEAREALAAPSMGSGGVALLERLGRRWYRLAYQSAPVRTAPLRVMDEVARRFDQARRILNLVTDRYLFPFRARWFAGPASSG